MNKSFLPILCAIFLLSGCASVRQEEAALYRADGVPVWVGKTFSNPRGLWSGPVREKGYYAYGEARYDNEKIAASAAALDAKVRLLLYVNSELPRRKKSVLTGVRCVDRFVSEDGTVYVLFFVSRKNAR